VRHRLEGSDRFDAEPGGHDGGGGVAVWDGIPRRVPGSAEPHFLGQRGWSAGPDMLEVHQAARRSENRRTRRVVRAIQGLPVGLRSTRHLLLQVHVVDLRQQHSGSVLLTDHMAQRPGRSTPGGRILAATFYSSGWSRW